LKQKEAGNSLTLKAAIKPHTIYSL